MDQINKEVIEEVLKTYKIISKTLQEIKDELALVKGPKDASTLYIINEFFSRLENERREYKCSTPDKNK